MLSGLNGNAAGVLLTGSAPAASAPDWPGQAAALAQLLRALSAQGYHFTVTTPVTHQRVLARQPGRLAHGLRDIFGWNRPFAPGAVTAELLALMQAAGIVQDDGALLRSKLRVASLGDDLLLHSGYPTEQDDAVFLGPDTYRFVRFLGQGMQTPFGWGRPLRLLDVGCGSGAGGLALARLLSGAGELTLCMNDINPLALRLTAVNAAVAGIPLEIAQGDALSAVSGNFDLIISNPPYLDDAAGRAYRHGGAHLGRALSVRIAAQALGRLAPGGQLLLYTGVAMLASGDPFLADMQPLLEAADCDWSYSEIDPDVFGEELAQAVYADVERIAAVGLVARKRVQAGR